jgi:hypothetical protein
MVEDGRIGTPDLLAIPPPLLSSAGRRSGAAYAQPSACSECPSFQIFRHMSNSGAVSPDNLV